MNSTNWRDYHDQTKNKPPNSLLLQALEFVIHKQKALDLGDGSLRDARYFLDEGFEVMVVDQEPQMMQYAETLHAEKLRCVVSSFADFDFPEETFDIASAMYALPFNPPDTFDRVMQNIKASLVKGGIFCGHFFGVRDEWSTNPDMTFHTKAQIADIFADMELIQCEEEEKDRLLADGTPKHWHLFYVIARK